jgi:hypothetical protein
VQFTDQECLSLDLSSVTTKDVVTIRETPVVYGMYPDKLPNCLPPLSLKQVETLVEVLSDETGKPSPPLPFLLDALRNAYSCHPLSSHEQRF